MWEGCGVLRGRVVLLTVCFQLLQESVQPGSFLAPPRSLEAVRLAVAPAGGAHPLAHPPSVPRVPGGAAQENHIEGSPYTIAGELVTLSRLCPKQQPARAQHGKVPLVADPLRLSVLTDAGGKLVEQRTHIIVTAVHSLARRASGK